MELNKGNNYIKYEIRYLNLSLTIQVKDWATQYYSVYSYIHIIIINDVTNL